MESFAYCLVEEIRRGIFLAIEPEKDNEKPEGLPNTAILPVLLL